MPRRVALGFGGALVALSAAALFSFAALSARGEKSALLRHTTSCQLAVEEVESSLLNSESALDAYLAHPDPMRLERYEAARAKLAPALERLGTLARTDAAERELLGWLEPHVESVRAGQARVRERWAAGDREGARALHEGQLRGGAAQRAREVLDDIEELEAREAIERDDVHAWTVGAANAVFVVAEVVLLALTLVGWRIVRDEIRARERAIAVQQRLVAMVSHDLRSPLHTVVGSAWSLARADLPDEARRTVRRIGSAARRMHRLIRDLLDWSRIHVGAELPVAARDTDLLDVCARVAEDLDPGTGRIQIDADGDTHAIVDPDRIEQVLANLLTNALRHGPPDRPVRVRIAGAGDAVRVEVRDEGPGIAPELRTHLFEPFRRKEGGGAQPDASVGLGLFIVRTIVEAHGGNVQVETAPGEGTTFAFAVPRHALAATGTHASA